MTRRVLKTILAVPLTFSLFAIAQDGTSRSGMYDLSGYGRGIPQIGTASSASEGTVGYEDFANRPVSRVGELAENVPGLIATQHSGTGKANQYFLRGFNLDHGTDLAGFVDGVPINMRSHGHGQGYLDLNFLIPELVQRIDYAKAPYAASAGDFSAAGTILIATVEAIDVIRRGPTGDAVLRHAPPSVGTAAIGSLMGGQAAKCLRPATMARASTTASGRRRRCIPAP